MKKDVVSHNIANITALHDSASNACALLKILANQDRLLILCELSKGTRNVGELEEILNIHQPTLSQQLTVLRKENLVATKRKGKYIYYNLASREAAKVMETLSYLYCENQTG